MDRLTVPFFIKLQRKPVFTLGKAMAYIIIGSVIFFGTAIISVVVGAWIGTALHLPTGNNAVGKYLLFVAASSAITTYSWTSKIYHKLFKK